MFVPIAGEIVGNMVVSGLVKEGATALELGSQTYSIDQKTIQLLEGRLMQHGLSTFADALRAFKEVTPAQRPRDPAPHMRSFFSALGFSTYESIDIGDYGDNHVMDLNEDISQKYSFKNEYDLVTNIGVSEHLINQLVFFKNAHNATKVGGFSLHILPAQGFQNHGFFNYQPRFFQDLAAANGYKIIELFLAERDRKILDLQKPSTFGTSFYFATHVLTKNPQSNILVVALLQKIRNEAFVTPLQGKYVGDITVDVEHNRYIQSKPSDSSTVPTKGYFIHSKISRPMQYIKKIQTGFYHVLRNIQRITLSF